MKKNVIRIIQLILIAIIIFSVYKILNYKQTEKEFDIKDSIIKEDIKIWEEEKTNNTTKIEPIKETQSEDEPVVEEKSVDEIESEKIAYLKEKYPAIIAWIKIPGTSIDLPVVQGKDNVFYLNHDYKGDYDVFGTVFMEVANESDFSDQNSTLYGHNVRSGKVFHELHKYREDDFVKTAPIIEISNLNGLYRYRIFAAYISDPIDNYRIANYDDKEFEKLYNRILKNNILDVELPENFDKFLTLQTCADRNKRLIIHAIYIED
ncbi:MAG: class B sortase [Tissierellia bacterium]|nr:class B sortase [Tissierellia bacterium]